MTPTTRARARALITPSGFLTKFIGQLQRRVLLDALDGEEGNWFADKLIELANAIPKMPVTYQQDGKGDAAVVHLHYFGAGDFHITELDMDGYVQQAFGLADMGDPELGYINITDLINNGFELDLHWTPKTLAEVKKVKR